MNPQKINGVWVDIDDLKSHIDLTDMFDETVVCPWHDDRNPSLHVYPDHVYCYSCGATADAISFIQMLYGLSFSQAVQYLVKQNGKNRRWRRI